MTAPEPAPVLLMARELDQGGVERDVAKIALHLDRSRFEPHVAAFHPFGMRYEELKAAGVPILHLPVRSTVSLHALRAGAAMRRYIRERGIRVVHAYDASGVFGAAVARLCRVPVVITSQLSYRDLLDARTQRLLRWSDRWAHAILVNCEALRRYMIESEGIAPGRIELCYNGVDTSQFHPADAGGAAERNGAPLTVGTVCALRPEKGLHLLQQAFARLHRMEPRARLLIVGSGAELPALRRRGGELGIAAATVFAPATPDVARWMHAMDIFVLPSLSEAFSNSLLEAMACGRAAVASRVGGTPEMLGENERGLLFERGDAEQLAARLQALAASPALRRELGDRAARFARERLSIRIAADTTGAIYEKLLRVRDPARFRPAPAVPALGPGRQAR